MDRRIFAALTAARPAGVPEVLLSQRWRIGVAAVNRLRSSPTLSN